MLALQSAGAAPDMVQIGNEINHGILWPEGHINNMDSLAQLVNSGIRAVRSVNPRTPVMLHIALGGQNDEARFFLDNMLVRGVSFDVIGLSYYPRWHNTLEDLGYNLDDLARRYDKDLVVVEYSQLKREVNDLAFNVANGHGKGTAIWEPLNTWEALFDKEGNATSFLEVFDDLHKKFISSGK
jgi:beta-galactosidase